MRKEFRCILFHAIGVIFLDHLRRRVSVDTLKFILFLYVQNVPHISLKMPMISGDEYPP